MLSKAGFTQIPKRGKGSHTVWSHPFYNGSIILSGKDGKSAQKYQEQQVQKAIRVVGEGALAGYSVYKGIQVAKKFTKPQTNIQ